MAPGDLTTLALVDAQLGLPSGNADEAVLSGLITGVSAFIATYCQREFQVSTYSDAWDGKGARRMAFPNWPVIAVTSLVIGGVTIPAGDPVSAPGYYTNANTLMLNGYCFTPGFGNVQIAYQAGYATIPADLELAAREAVIWMYRERLREGKASEAIAGETTSYRLVSLPPRAQAIVDLYRKVVPV